MDIDRISYIFGSFTRRRQNEEAGSKRRSKSSAKSTHQRSRSNPLDIKKSLLNPRAKSMIGTSFDDTKFKCSICKNQFVEPRVLPCLHTFCLNCLETLEISRFVPLPDSVANGEKSNNGTHSRKPSLGVSASEREKHTGVPGYIYCPTCKSPADISVGGVQYFPPNYSIQHQMVLATLNSSSTHLLCDLCSNEVTATSRCMDCAISFCTECKEIHSRQKSTSDHEILSLDAARERGITKIRKQVMCLLHPKLEVTSFCSTCYQVVCTECVSISHRSHVCEPLNKVARHHIGSLRMAANKAKALVERSATDTSILSATSKRIDAECNKIQSEIEKFIEDYIESINKHKQILLDQVRQIREEKIQQVTQEKLKLQRKIRDARDIAYFLDDLLNEGSDVEVLSFIKPMIDKIEACDNLEPTLLLKHSDNIQFLPEEAVNDSNVGFKIYGVLSTQTVSAEHCRIDSKDLQNLRVGKKVNVVLETRDNKDYPLERGGECVTAEVEHRIAGISRSVVVSVLDQRNGTYGISFVPDVPGRLAFLIKVNEEHIQGSPFPITVRSLKPHHGTFHCCSFCSSGGSKEATCGCEGRMPGGYKGCGHGHEGHPGKRHWSCCGNILEHSECGRSRSNSHYQFTV